MICKDCNGSGKLALFTSVETCKKCGGTGKVIDEESAKQTENPVNGTFCLSLASIMGETEVTLPPLSQVAADMAKDGLKGIIDGFILGYIVGDEYYPYRSSVCHSPFPKCDYFKLWATTEDGKCCQRIVSPEDLKTLSEAACTRRLNDRETKIIADRIASEMRKTDIPTLVAQIEAETIKQTPQWIPSLRFPGLPSEYQPLHKSEPDPSRLARRAGVEACIAILRDLDENLPGVYHGDPCGTIALAIKRIEDAEFRPVTLTNNIPPVDPKLVEMMEKIRRNCTGTAITHTPVAVGDDLYLMQNGYVTNDPAKADPKWPASIGSARMVKDGYAMW